LMIELMQIETYVPFYMQNLTEIFFLIKLNHPYLSNEETQKLLDLLENIPIFIDNNCKENHELEDLDKHL